ncbi:MAG: DUF3307 domain-containing protein [Firmicutes bacterium]|nr:DUF3307 domain-containing protein [Bacillota bacterium]
MTMLWLLWFAHVTSDFLFGSYELPGTEPGTPHPKCLVHGLITFLCTLAVMHIYGWRAALVAGGLVTAGHILLDILMTLGCALWSRYQGTPKESGVAGLLVDQILHLWMLIWVWGLVEKPPSVPVVTFYQNIIPFPNVFQDIGKFALVASGLVFVCYGGAVFVRRALDSIFANVQGLRDTENPAGKYIGILERLLIFILVLSNSLEGVTFLFAAKSITRYKRISEERNFAEYYLIGTLLSIIWALAIGLGLKGILAKGFS